MDQKRQYDIIIAGAGASGLSLAWNILQQPELKARKILLVDRSLEPVRDKTWCFWDDRYLPFNELIHHSWTTLLVRAHGHLFSGALKKYRYQCIKSDDYTRGILSVLSDAPNVTMLKADIMGFSNQSGLGVVETSVGNFKAHHVFQSTTKPPDYKFSRVDISLIQHFKGWHIRTRLPVFDPRKATLMDFDLPQIDGVTFVYVLPFNENEALVEYTLFSENNLDNEAYDTGLANYLADRYDLEPTDYDVIYTEMGQIPMEDRKHAALFCDRVWNTGSIGGGTKPSTGYAFTRIQKQSRKIAEALSRGDDPDVVPSSSYRFRVYDIMMLYQLHRHPEQSVHLFHEMFRNNKFDRILQFLEEGTRPDQELRIFYSLPWLPFFESIYKMKHRIFTGA